MESDSKITKLETELYQAYKTIIDLQPEHIQRILSPFQNSQEDDSHDTWKNKAMDDVLSVAEVKSSDEMGVPGFDSGRAYCPLCGDSAHTIYGSEGFAFPQGLRRHLNGNNHIRQCSVFRAALKLRQSHFR